VRSSQASAVLGVVSTLAGTGFAYLMLPQTPSAQGALVTPCIILALGILTVPLARLITRSSAALNAENFVAVGIVYWILLDPIQGAYDLMDTSDKSIELALAAVGLTAAAMWAGTFGRPWRVPAFIADRTAQPLEVDTLRKMIPLCFALGMAKFVYYVDFDIPEMFSYLGKERWSAPWGRGQLGGWDAFLDHTQYFGYLLPSLAMLLVVKRGWLRPDTLLGLAAAVIMTLFLAQGGGRRIIGVTIGAAIIVWILAQPGFRISKLLGVVVGIFGLLLGMQFILEIRSVGVEEFFARGAEFDYLHVDDNFLRLSQVIDLVPNEHPFVYFQQILFTLVRPIPRVFWEGKPVSPGFDLATTLGMDWVSLSTSIIGEWYISLGWAAVAFGGWLHGRLACLANSMRDPRYAASNPVIYSLAVMVLVSGVRSMQDLVIMSYAILAWFGVAWLVNRKPRERGQGAGTTAPGTAR
jgi:oligosaccharide repeat unit polymerase